MRLTRVENQDPEIARMKQETGRRCAAVTAARENGRTGSTRRAESKTRTPRCADFDSGRVGFVAVHALRAFGTTPRESTMSRPRRTIVCSLACVSLLGVGSFAARDDRAPDGLESLRAEIDSLKSRVKNQDEEIARLKAEQGAEWLTEERSKEIRSIVQDVLADSDMRASFAADGATSGYNRGFFIASPDGNWKLVVGGQLLLRYAFSRLSSRSLQQLNPGTYQPPATGAQASFPGGAEIKGYQGFFGQNTDIARTARGFEVRQAKLIFEGHVVDPSWQYRVNLDVQQTTNQTAFSTVSTSSSQFGEQSTGPTSGNASQGPGNAGGVAGLEDAWIRKQIDPNWSVRVGQFKSPFLKEELVSDTRILAADRSLVNQFFSTKRTQGIELTFQNDCIRIMASFNDGGNNNNGSAVIGNNEFNGTFAEWAFTGRAEWKIAGDWAQFGDMSSPNGDSFAAYVGAAVNWQRGGGDPGDPYNNSWTVAGGANGLMTGGGALFGNGATVMVPVAAAQYPNNIPTNANDDVTNLTYTVDTMIDFGGLSMFAAFIGNVAYGIPAGWVANPSGGYTTLSGTGNGPNIVPNNVSGIPSNGSNGAVSYFVPGYGYGYSPIFSYGVVVQAGWFVVDDIELFGRYEWYDTLHNGANAYAGNTASFWGALPGGDSPFANNTRTNNAGSVPNGANTPSDSYLGGNTNPYYAVNFGSNPYAAQMNSIITGGVNWYPAGVKNQNIKVTADLAYSLRAVLFQNGIYGQGITNADYRYDGGQPGGGQWVGRFQIQLLF
ncbi:MAG: hypothetical protein FJ253_03975 [Phycisphaerae bacterium]|nr:hypothetical protein [Phycisphaerae bacterium]